MFKEEILVFSDFIESVSELELTKDGFYTVVSYIIDIEIQTKQDQVKAEVLQLYDSNARNDEIKNI